MERTDGKNSKLFSFLNRAKPAWLQGFRWTKRTAPRKISSAAPSTTRTTLRVYFCPVFFPEICSKIRWRENRRDGKKYSILRFSVLRNIKENQGDEIPSFCRNFECCKTLADSRLEQDFSGRFVKCRKPRHHKGLRTFRPVSARADLNRPRVQIKP